MKILSDTDTHLFWEEEGIICFKYKDPIVDLEVARKGFEIRKTLTIGSSYLIYADLTGVSNVTREARVFYASKEGRDKAIATAVLAPSALTKIMSTFFMSFNRPAVPFRFFISKEKAFKWLHEIQDGDKIE